MDTIIDETTIETKPFNIIESTLTSVMEWIDKITNCSLGWFDGNPISPNDMIVVKYKMVKMLILKSSNLIRKDIKDIKEKYYKIEFSFGNNKGKSGKIYSVPAYSKKVDYELDDIIEDVQLSIKNNGYFISSNS